jgi:hypothetical protein
MLALLVLASIVAVLWGLNAPAQRFLPAFARLLTGSTIHAGSWSVLSGRSTAAGTFGGRDVSIELKARRGRHDQGYLVVAMRTNGASVLDAASVDARATGEAARRALFVLATHDVRLTVEDRWLKARWQPQGFVFFPGAFVESTWLDVLHAMHVVAASLDPAVEAL